MATGSKLKSVKQRLELTSCAERQLQALPEHRGPLPNLLWPPDGEQEETLLHLSALVHLIVFLSSQAALIPGCFIHHLFFVFAFN